MLKVRHKGNFELTERFFMSAAKGMFFSNLEKYARMGVEALASATPVDSGETANSWGYNVIISPEYVAVEWTNDNFGSNANIPIALMIQCGHGTKNGGFVKGIDYINPALQSIFDAIARDVWKEVRRT